MGSNALKKEIEDINGLHAIESGRTATVKKKKKRRTKAGKISGAGKSKQKYKTAVRKREATIYAIEALAMLAALGCVIGFLLWYNSFTKIKLSDYTVLTLSGFDNYGSADVEVDLDPAYPDFWSTVTASVDSRENLSNGDSLTITYIYDEKVAKESRLKVDSSDAVITVSGLAAPTIVDEDYLFSGLDIVQEGISPKVTLALDNNSEDGFVSQVVYSLDTERSFYANGDEVRITAEIPDELLTSHQYVLDSGVSDCVYTYTVAGDQEYITDASYITDEVLTELENAAIDLLMAGDANEYGLRIFQQEAHIQAQFVGNKTTFKWVNPYVISAYFHSVTDEGIQYVENHTNDVQIVIGVTIAQQNGSKAFAEAVVQFTNLIADSNGNLDLGLDTGRLVSCTYKDKNVKELVKGDSDGNYNTTKLTE